MEMFQGTFQWLIDSEDEYEERLSPEDLEKLQANLNHLIALIEKYGLKLPTSFIRFIASPHLRNRIPSCTDCYFDLSDRLTDNPDENGGYLIRFLNDSQSVLQWYLYLHQKADLCVIVASPEFLDQEGGETLDDVIVPRNLFYCAPSFEAFIYRFWIENSIWIAFYEEQSLTKTQQKHMDARSN